MERDDNNQMKQEQEEHEQWIDAQTKREMNAISDAEFYHWIGSIEQDCQQAKQ